MAPRLLITRKEAAEALGMSLSHFQRHVQPFISCVYSGQLRLYRPVDLETWAEQTAQAPPEGIGRGSHQTRQAVASRRG